MLHVKGKSNRVALAYTTVNCHMRMRVHVMRAIYNKYNQLICPLVSTGNLPTGCPLVICRTGLYAGVKKLVPFRGFKNFINLKINISF